MHNRRSTTCISIHAARVMRCDRAWNNMISDLTGAQKGQPRSARPNQASGGPSEAVIHFGRGKGKKWIGERQVGVSGVWSPAPGPRISLALFLFTRANSSTLSLAFIQISLFLLRSCHSCHFRSLLLLLIPSSLFPTGWRSYRPTHTWRTFLASGCTPGPASYPVRVGPWQASYLA